MIILNSNDHSSLLQGLVYGCCDNSKTAHFNVVRSLGGYYR